MNVPQGDPSSRRVSFSTPISPLCPRERTQSQQTPLGIPRGDTEAPLSLSPLGDSSATLCPASNARASRTHGAVGPTRGTRDPPCPPATTRYGYCGGNSRFLRIAVRSEHVVMGPARRSYTAAPLTLALTRVRASRRDGGGPRRGPEGGRGRKYPGAK